MLYGGFEIHTVLISTYWNVNSSEDMTVNEYFEVLISTYWNVN